MYPLSRRSSCPDSVGRPLSVCAVQSGSQFSLERRAGWACLHCSGGCHLSSAFCPRGTALCAEWSACPRVPVWCPQSLPFSQLLSGCPGATLSVPWCQPHTPDASFLSPCSHTLSSTAHCVPGPGWAPGMGCAVPPWGSLEAGPAGGIQSLNARACGETAQCCMAGAALCPSSIAAVTSAAPTHCTSSSDRAWVPGPTFTVSGSLCSLRPTFSLRLCLESLLLSPSVAGVGVGLWTPPGGGEVGPQRDALRKGRRRKSARSGDQAGTELESVSCGAVLS